MDGSAIFNSIISVAKMVGPMIVPGAGEAIALGAKVLEMIDTAKATFSETDPVKLDEARAALEARVNAHVDSTVDKLRGEK